MVTGTSRVPTRHRLEQEGLAFWNLLVACLKSQVGPEHHFLERTFCLAEVWQLLWCGR